MINIGDVILIHGVKGVLPLHFVVEKVSEKDRFVDAVAFDADHKVRRLYNVSLDRVELIQLV